MQFTKKKNKKKKFKSTKIIIIGKFLHKKNYILPKSYFDQKKNLISTILKNTPLIEMKPAEEKVCLSTTSFFIFELFTKFQQR